MDAWPVARPPDEVNPCNTDALDVSRLFVERLLSSASSGLTPSQRILSLNLLNPSEQQRIDLERFLTFASTLPLLLLSLPKLADYRHLWIHELNLEGATHAIQNIELIPWRTRQNKLAKWSSV